MVNDAHMDGEGPVEEVFLVAQVHELDQLLAGAAVDAAAAVAGVHEGPQADAGQMPRLAGGDVPEEMTDDPLGQVVGLDLVGDGQLLEARHQAPVAADHPPHEARVAKVVEAALLAVALAGGIDQGQIAGPAFHREGGLVAGQEHLLDGDGDALGEADADEAAGGHRVPVADEAHRLGRGQYLAAPGRHDAAQYRMGNPLLHVLSPLVLRVFVRSGSCQGCPTGLTALWRNACQ
jgi:hypothetical protein